MLRYLLPLGTGVLMAGFVLCQDLTTGAGDPFDTPADGVLEDWCNLSAWSEPASFFGDLDLATACSLGLRVYVEGDALNDRRGASIYRTATPLVDMRDRALYFALRPIEDAGGGWSGIVSIYSTTDFAFSFFAQWLADGSGFTGGTSGVPALYANIFYTATTNAEALMDPYLYDGVHSFWRVIYSTVDGMWFFQLADYCGTWTTVLSGAAPESSARNVSMEIAFEANFSGASTTITGDGFVSPLLIKDFP